MAKRLLLTIVIFLAMVSPSIALIGSFNTIVQTLKNLLPLTKGGIQFIKDYVRFQASEFSDTTPSNREEYDFVIVGAGSAGATIASKLTEVKEAKVLLIEAGGHENLIMDVPLLALYLQFDKGLHWDYLTEPSDNYCLGMKDHQCRVPVGKVVGGTSTLNFMMAIRGNKKDYDEWAELTGDKSWSYDNMLNYFKKLEHCNLTQTEMDPEFRSFDGPISITNVPYRTAVIDAFIKAGEEMGLPPVDYNGRTQTGFSYLQTTQSNGERVSANRAYLHPVKNRKNLFLSMNSHVNKILIDPEMKKAYGVEFTKDGKKIEVLARKEVILSAGALGSPKLLMLSGIGPAEHLQNLNINVLKDAPVGENLMDHIAYGGLTFLVNETVGLVIPEFFDPRNPTISKYLTERKGPLATPVGLEGLGYVNVDDPNIEDDAPNVEFMFGSITFESGYLLHKAFGITEEYWKKSFADKLYRHGWIIWPVLLHPKSRGKVLLRSADPMAKPKLITNYLSDPDDVRVAVKGIRKAIEVSKTKAMQRFDSQLFNIKIPGCENHESDSDAYWECAFRTYTMTIWHFCGTCKMGREDDPSAVVNSKLQVKGIKGLRVIDASIMPKILTAHLNVPTIAIAEKLADILKSDWGYISI